MDQAVDIPALGTAKPSGDLPPAPVTGEVSQLPPKRTRKRKSAQPDAPAPATEQPQAVAPAPTISADEQKAINQALGLGIRILFELAATRRGEHWKLGDGEVGALSEAWGVALAPWIARGAQYVPLATAALVTAGVIVPRLSADAEQLKREADGISRALHVRKP